MKKARVTVLCAIAVLLTITLLTGCGGVGLDADQNDLTMAELRYKAALEDLLQERADEGVILLNTATGRSTLISLDEFFTFRVDTDADEERLRLDVIDLLKQEFGESWRDYYQESTGGASRAVSGSNGWMDAKHGWWTALFVGRAWADTYQGDGNNASSLNVFMRYVFSPSSGEYSTVSSTEYNTSVAKVSAWLGGTFVLPSIDYTNHSGVYGGDYRFLSLEGRF